MAIEVEESPVRILEEPDVRPFDKRLRTARLLQHLAEARSPRAIRDIETALAESGPLDGKTSTLIRRRREEVLPLRLKTRKIAWLWANVYGYGSDSLFPTPLFGKEAAFLVAVEAGNILVLDRDRNRLACFLSTDGCSWKRVWCRRRTKFDTQSAFVCKVRRPGEPHPG